MKDVNLEELHLDYKETNKYKRRTLFSKAIFFESFKSNWLGQVIVSLANALLIVVVILILANLNSTSNRKGLASLIDSAGTEQTVKQGVVGYYAAFDAAALAYEELDEGQLTLVNTLDETYTILTSDETNTFLNYLPTINSLFETYLNREGASLESAKTSLNSAIDTILNLTSLEESYKDLVKNLLDNYLDNYYYYVIHYTESGLEQPYTSEECIYLSIAQSAVEYIPTLGYNLSDPEFVQNYIFENLRTNVPLINAESDETAKAALIDQYSWETSFDLINYMVDEEQSEYIGQILDAMKEGYEADSEKYINNTDNYRSLILINNITNIVMSEMDEMMYYSYLPDFTNDIATNDLGYPIHYVDSGEKDENGNIIYKEEVLTSYSPDLFVLKPESMRGANANLVEKMHKDIITGEPYTEEEINKAKEDSKENLDLIQSAVNDFLFAFIERDENNTNEFYDGSNIIQEGIIDYSIEQITNMAVEQTIDQFNEENETNITSIYSITYENYTVSGTYMVDTLTNYATSGIYSYIKFYNQRLSEGYTTSDATLSAMNSCSITTLSQLPNTLYDVLDEMSEMNLYGLIIGVVVFGMAAILLPLVYSIILANSLVSEKVESGSLAFILSTPTRRSTFIATQATYLIISELAMGVMMFISSLLARAVGIAVGGVDLINSLSINYLTLFSIGATCAILAISGICFLTSCIFNKSKYSIGVGGGINIFFYIASILGLFGSESLPSFIRIDSMNVFNYMSILSLNNGQDVLNGNLVEWVIKIVALLVIAAICYTVGSHIFTKKDLPL